MTGSDMAWVVITDVVAVVAAWRLFRASGRPEPSVRNGYRWLAVAALCWAVGSTTEQAFGGLLGGSSPLRLSDLISLATVAALVIGVATLTAGRPDAEDARLVPSTVIDCCLLVTALFVIGWLTIFGQDYIRVVDVGPPEFTLDLAHPLAGLLALGVLVPFALRAPQLALRPVFALAAIGLGDALAVGSRDSGMPPSAATQLCWLTGLVVLALAPAASGARSKARVRADRVARLDRGAGRHATPVTWLALGATVVAGLLLAGYSLAGRVVTAPALAITCAVVVLMLVLRTIGLARGASAAGHAGPGLDPMFRALAERTSDAVLVCDPAGVIGYANPATAGFGYRPADLVGTSLAHIVHPQDRPAGYRAALNVLRRAGHSAQFAGRILAADGSWRQVDATLARYSDADPAGRLLVTARDLSDEEALRRQLTQLTFHDGLTGLPNRAFVEQQLRGLSAADGQDYARPAIGLILLDLVGYAQVNDMIGRTAANLVLAQIGRRLRAAAPGTATVARWGGDQFAVLVPDAITEADVIELAERLARQIGEEPFDPGGTLLSLRASTGVAVGYPGGEPKELATQAGVALIKAKSAAGRLEVFAEPMIAEVRHRRELAAELSQAIADHAVEVRYLPIADLGAEHVVGVEALVRWPREGHSADSADLDRVAEETGLATALGMHVLRTAGGQVAAWRAAGWQIGLTVPLSAWHASTLGFADEILAEVTAAGLAPSALTITLPERVLIGPAGLDLADLDKLKAGGVRIAIGSFGIEQAALVRVGELAPDAVRIDASLVAGVGGDQARTSLVQAIAGFCRTQGIEVVACGIGHVGQLAQLRAMGCALGQGDAIGPPMTAANIAELAPDSVQAGTPAQAG